MNAGQLAKWAHDPKMLAGAAGLTGALVLGLRARAKAKAAGDTSTVGGTTGKVAGTYDSVASDVYNSIEPQLEALAGSQSTQAGEISDLLARLEQGASTPVAIGPSPVPGNTSTNPVPVQPAPQAPPAAATVAPALVTVPPVPQVALPAPAPVQAVQLAAGQVQPDASATGAAFVTPTGYPYTFGGGEFTSGPPAPAAAAGPVTHDVASGQLAVGDTPAPAPGVVATFVTPEGYTFTTGDANAPTTYTPPAPLAPYVDVSGPNEGFAAFAAQTQQDYGIDPTTLAAISGI